MILIFLKFWTSFFHWMWASYFVSCLISISYLQCHRVASHEMIKRNSREKLSDLFVLASIKTVYKWLSLSLLTAKVWLMYSHISRISCTRTASCIPIWCFVSLCCIAELFTADPCNGQKVWNILSCYLAAFCIWLLFFNEELWYVVLYKCNQYVFQKPVNTRFALCSY